MAKGAYIGVGGKARKIKKGYIGVGGKARKIKKAYIGIGGKARPCFGNGEVAYYGRITSLQKGRAGMGTGTIGNNVIFAGGEGVTITQDPKLVDVYSSELVHSTPFSLSATRYNTNAASNDNYFIFPGGSGSSSYLSTVDAYNASFVKQSVAGLQEAIVQPFAGVVGGYIAFAGGKQTSGGRSTLYAYNSSLSQSVKAGLTNYRYGGGSAMTSKHFVCAGGTAQPYSSQKTTATSDVDAINGDLTTTIASPLSTAGGCHAVSHNGLAVFVIGTSIETYDANLTKQVVGNISVARTGPAKVSLGGYVVFAGGLNSAGDAYYTSAEVYDESWTRTIPDFELSAGRRVIMSATVGKYAILAGGAGDSVFPNTSTGQNNSRYCPYVEALTIV